MPFARLKSAATAATTATTGTIGNSASARAMAKRAAMEATKGAATMTVDAKTSVTSNATVRALEFVVKAVRWLIRATTTQIAVATATTAIGFVLGAMLTVWSKRTRDKDYVRRALISRRRRKDADASPSLTWLESVRAKKELETNEQDQIHFKDEFKTLFNTYSPKWTEDASFNRVHWLNRVIDAAWPNIDTGVSKTVKESVEPILRDMLPESVTWIGFEKFTLGPRAPTLSGIRSHSSHMENSILDIELTWASSCEIIVTLYAFGIRFPVSLRQLQLKCLVQVTFDPLVDIIPCLGAIEACLMGMPEILDFGLFLPGGIDLMALPFMHGFVKRTVKSSIEKMLLYPYKLHIPIMEASGIEESSTGMMRIRFLKGNAFYKRRNYSRLSRKKGKASSLMRNMLKSDNYFIKYWTREQRQLSTPPRLGDAPSWDGVEDSFVLCDRETPLTFRLLKQGAERISNYGEASITCGEIADRGPGPIVLELPFIDPTYYKKECPLEYFAAANGYTHEQIMTRINEITEWHKKSEEEADEARMKYFYRCVEEQNKTKTPGGKKFMHPTMTVELEYIDTGAPDEFDEDYEQGLLTVELLEGRNLLRVKDLPPNPMAHVSCAKQTYTSARKLKTSQPKFNERFVFYNVIPDVDPLRIEIRGFEVSLGFVEIDVSLVRQNVIMKDVFKLQGVAKGEIELLLQYAPMSTKNAVHRIPVL